MQNECDFLRQETVTRLVFEKQNIIESIVKIMSTEEYMMWPTVGILGWLLCLLSSIPALIPYSN